MNKAIAITIMGIVTACACNVANALPGHSNEAPQRSVDACLAELSAHADYKGAGSVRHNVKTEARRVSGHTLQIETLVFDGSDSQIIRGYSASCVLDGNAEIQRFKIRRKSL